MDCYATLILLFFGFSFSSCSPFPLREYYYVNLKITWNDAQDYCREKYNDLATIESMDDIYRLKPDFSYSRAWIGLKDDPKSWKGVMGNDSNSWRWSTTGETSKISYHKWNENEPDNRNAKEDCALMGENGEWYDAVCETSRSFICYNVTNQNEKTYVFISAAKTWKSAQAYCRKHHTDLPMIENTEENNKIFSIIASPHTWIGLYREPWTWSDKTQSSFRFWKSSSPYHSGDMWSCMAENQQHEWDEEDCQSKYPFICQQVSKLKTMVRMKIQTDADITDPATNAQILQQLGAVLTSQGWTHFKLQWKIQPRQQEKEKFTEH